MRLSFLSRTALARGLPSLGLGLSLALGAPGCDGDNAGTASDAGGAKGELCDSDADCEDGIFCNGEETCSPLHVRSDGRGCLPGLNECLSEQICHEAEQSCETPCDRVKDADGDGVEAIECGGADCDDSDSQSYPGNSEVCDADNRDEDCDPTTFGYRDADGDQFPDALCCNPDGDGQNCGDDCNDQDPRTHPTQLELCDGIDNDCNGQTDDLNGEAPAYFADTDGDLFGDPQAPLLSCGGDLKGYVRNADDCDDGDSRIHPLARDDNCDGKDNNCSGKADSDAISVYYEDLDGDGHGNPAAPAPPCSILGQGAAADNRDCDDDDNTRSPSLTEVRCDGVDNNCNGVTDADGTAEPTWYVDADEDGYGDHSLAAYVGCNPVNPSKWTVSVIADCDDTRSQTHPGAAELCDGLDNNCSNPNGSLFEPTEDEDGDLHTKSGFMGCTGGFAKDDCDDANNQKYPGNALLCDGIDNNCDGETDAIDDEDRDGFVSLVCGGQSASTDCDDENEDIYPGADQICDNLQNDCSLPDAGTFLPEDNDLDGLRSPDAVCLAAPDCNDDRAASAEVCDRLDNDCTGGLDEGCPGAPNHSSVSVTTRLETMTNASGSATMTESLCPSGEFAVGARLLSSTSSSTLFAIAARCAPLALMGQGAPPFGAFDVEWRDAAVQPYARLRAAPGAPSQSTETDYSCSSGSALSEIKLASSASAFDAFEAQCRNVDYAHPAGTFSLGTLESAGAMGSAWPLSGSCPAGKLAIGVRAWAYADTGAEVEVVCGTPTATVRAPLGTLIVSARANSSKATLVSGQSVHEERFCPEGTIPSGAQLSLDSVLSNIYAAGFSLRCREITAGGAIGRTLTDAGVVVRNVDQLLTADCGQGLLVGVHVPDLERLTAICRPFTLSAGSSGQVLLGEAYNALSEKGGGGDRHYAQCPGGKVAVGFEVGHDGGTDDIESLQLRCAALEIVP